MSGYRLGTEDRERVWKLHGEGQNPNEIATTVGRAYSTIATMIKATGGVRPDAPRRSELRLSPAEREEISLGVRAHETFAAIAGRLGRSPSTVSREVARNGGRSGYRAVRADRQAIHLARRPKTPKLSASAALRDEVEAKLRHHWSPQQIAAWLRLTFPDDPTLWISHETIYTSVFRHVKGLSPRMCRYLRSGRDRRRPRRRGRGERRGKNPNMVLIGSRPSTIENRKQPGHWEGDLIMGRGHRRAIGTLVERTSRFLQLLDLTEGFSGELMNAELLKGLGPLPEHLRRSLTWDQGTEMSAHETFTRSSGISVYFCHPRSPWERGTNENTNGLLRQYFPKGVDLGGVTRDRLDHVAYELNHRPRQVLKWLTPAQRFDQLVR